MRNKPLGAKCSDGFAMKKAQRKAAELFLVDMKKNLAHGIC
jgi:hypothetical protein